MTLTTQEKSPKVRRLIGIKRIFNTGLMTNIRSESNKPDTNNVIQLPVTINAGNISLVSQSANT